MISSNSIALFKRMLLWFMVLKALLFTPVNTQYHFLQMRHRLFATDGSVAWYLSESYSFEPNNPTSPIAVVRDGPYQMWTDKLQVNLTSFDQAHLRFVFMAKFAEGCTFLVFVNQELNYQSWSVRVNNKFFTNAARSATSTKDPFKLTMASKCAGSIDTSGNLGDLLDLKQLLSDQTLTSVMANHNNTVLYFMGSSHYVQLDLSKWDRHQEVCLEGFSETKPLYVKRSDADTIVLFRDKYALRTIASQTKICPIKTTIGMRISPKCRLLRLMHSRYTASSEVHNRNLNDDEYADYGVTPILPISPQIILLIVLILVVLFSIVIYILYAKYCCGNTAALMPGSSFNSNILGKLHSASTIKTIDSNKSAIIRHK